MTPLRIVVLARPIAERAYEAGLAANVSALIALRAEAGKGRRFEVNRHWQRGRGAALEAEGAHLIPGNLSWAMHVSATRALERKE